MTSDAGAAYADGRRRLSELLATAGPDAAAATVPACPAWTVHDVISHLAGACADIVAGNLDGVAEDPWTHAQVAPRRERSLDEVLAEWTEVAPQVEAMATSTPHPAWNQWVFDFATHEQDVRGALGRPGGRDSDAVAIGLGFALGGLAEGVAAAGMPALVVRFDGEERLLGAGKPGATLTADRFELLRTVSGRRSAAQIRALDWDGDPEPYLPILAVGPLSMPETDLIE